MAAAELQLALDLWEAVRDSLPAGKRADAASGIMNALAEYGLEAADLGDVVDEDDDLAEAYRDVFEEDADEEEDEDEV